MALEDTLARIPGLGGYLAQGQYDQRQALGNVQGAMQIARLIESVRDRQMQAQLQPLKERLLAAQAGSAEGQEAERKRADAFHNLMPQLVQRATDSEGRLDYGRLADAALATPGGAAFATGLRRTEEDRAARIEAAQQRVQQQYAETRRRIEADLARSQDRDERTRLTGLLVQSKIDHQNAMAELRGEAIADRRARSGADKTPRTTTVFSGGKNRLAFQIGTNFIDVDTGEPLTGVEPQKTSADVKADLDRAENIARAQSLTQMLDRMDALITNSPKTIAGPLSPFAGAVRYGAAQFGGERPGTEFEQLVETSLNTAVKAGKLSNQERDELRKTFKTGVTGDPNSVKKGIALFRQLSGIPAVRGQQESPRGATGIVRPADDPVERWRTPGR